LLAKFAQRWIAPHQQPEVKPEKYDDEYEWQP
jgi:hypothetical protein